jgi:hypothetical protein
MVRPIAKLELLPIGRLELLPGAKSEALALAFALRCRGNGDAIFAKGEG